VPLLAHIANLWSLECHPSPTREWSLEQKIKAVAAAGFQGITAALTPAHRRLAEKHSLHHLIGYVATDDPADYAPRLRAQKAGGAVHVNVQLDNHDTPPALAAKHWLQFVRTAEEIGGLVVSLETHRDTCTETPEKTYEIAARYHAATGELIKLNFDFSHFASVKHLRPDNYVIRLLDHPALLQHSEQAHFRPFNGHHCQVPVTFQGRLSPECESYLLVAAAGMRIW